MKTTSNKAMRVNMLRKFLIAIFYIFIALFIYIFREPLLNWVNSSPSIALVLLFATMMSLFPVIPYPVIGGILGAVYGAVWGSFFTWFGSTAASILLFLFVRFGYQDWGQRLLNKYNRIQALSEQFDRNAFLVILFARMIPFIPSIIINIYAALNRVSFLTYSIASALGKVPAMILFAIIGDSLTYSWRQAAIALVIYGFFLSATLFIHSRWKKMINK
jgi:uncharacterized membrane protein YdjX (TVP38/TMEM64 family)